MSTPTPPVVIITPGDRAAWLAAFEAYVARTGGSSGHSEATYKIAEYVADLKAQALTHDRAKSELFELVGEACRHLRGPEVCFAWRINLYAREARAELETLRAEVALLRNQLARSG